METEGRKEGGEEFPDVESLEEPCCEMDRATQDMLVGHSHGSLLAAVGAVELEGMEGCRLQLAGGKAEVFVAEFHKRQAAGLGRNQPSLAAHDSGNKMPGDEEDGAHSQDLFVAEKRIFEFDKVVENRNVPSVAEHLRSFLGTECF
ncbi:hypothetical protein U1Q18_002209 [Sarracenia purpurea var. burkii]